MNANLLRCDNDFMVKPVRISLLVAAVVVGILPCGAMAGIIDTNEKVTIDANTIAESWTVRGGTLNVTQGGKTLGIIASYGGMVNLYGAIVDQIISGGNSTSNNALTLHNSQATINNSHLKAVSGIGINLTGPAHSTSIADVSNSKIDVAGRGVNMVTGAQLNLDNTQISGVEDNKEGFYGGGYGATMSGGTITASNGTHLAGNRNGILMTVIDIPRALSGKSVLTLDNSHVSSKNGSAIKVEAYDADDVAMEGKSIINIKNGSTLTSGNGNLVEVHGFNTATINVDNSQLRGDIVAVDTATAHVNLTNQAVLTGDLNGVAQVVLDNSQLTGNIIGDTKVTTQVSLQNNAHFSGTFTHVEQVDIKQGTTWLLTGSTESKTLVLDNGRVDFASPEGDHRTLTLDSLHGQGDFLMNSSIADGQADLLKVNADASGQHRLFIKDTGAEPAAEMADKPLTVVQTGGGDAIFSLNNDVVDLGTYQYALRQNGNDWELSQQSTLTSAARTVLGIFDASPTVWLGELQTLRTRLGNVRSGKQDGGMWMQAIGNQYNISHRAGNAYKQKQTGLSFGADTFIPVDNGRVLLGGMTGYTSNRLDLGLSSQGDIDSYFLGGYATWLADSGWYLDTLLKANRFSNRAQARTTDGSSATGRYKNAGLGLSLELGRQISFAENWFIEPSARYSALLVSGKKYNLNNGLKAKGERAKAQQASLNMVLGKNIELKSGATLQPYGRLSLVRDFSNNKVSVNDNSFRNNLSGSRGQYALGLSAGVAKNVQVYTEASYSKGNKIETPWTANLGVRVTW